MLKLVFVLVAFASLQLSKASSELTNEPKNEQNGNSLFDTENDSLISEQSQPVGSIRVRKLSDRFSNEKENNFESYTMYVSTNESCNSNMFGWFFKNLVS